MLSVISLSWKPLGSHGINVTHSFQSCGPEIRISASALTGDKAMTQARNQVISSKVKLAERI